MIAIETGTEEGKPVIAIAPQGVKIKSGTVGYFIAQDAEEVRRVTVFCKVNSRTNIKTIS